MDNWWEFNTDSFLELQIPEGLTWEEYDSDG